LKRSRCGAGGLVSEALVLVVLVLAVVAGIEIPLRVAFGGQDVRADAVQEPAVVRDHHARPGEFGEGIFERTQRLNVEIVRRFVEKKHVAAREKRLREVEASTLASR
jgi:hypothetical protein